MTLTDDATLLYSRQTLMHQLSAILRTRCEVPNPYHVVDLHFNSNQLAAASAHWSLGTLVVDGFQYGNRGGPTVPAASVANGRVTSSSPRAYFPVSTASRGEPAQQLSSDQRLQKLQRMLELRRLEQQRMQTPGAALQMKAPNYTVAASAVAGTSSFQSQMPNQSSNISSSNQLRHDASNSRAAATGYVPTVHTKNYAPHNSISLAQLQEERQRLQNHHEQVTTTLQPIVIQPTNLPDQSKFDDFCICTIILIIMLIILKYIIYNNI